jgi:hypothetical protein
VKASPPAEFEWALRDKMYGKGAAQWKDPIPCHGRHGIDAAGAKDGTGQEGPRKRLSGKDSEAGVSRCASHCASIPRGDRGRSVLSAAYASSV